MSRTVNFDHAVLGQLTINHMASPSFVAKLKLVNSKTGYSYGSITMSEAMLTAAIKEKLAELQKVIEDAAERLVFSDFVESAATTNDSGGLGEHLDGGEPPSV